MLKSDGNLVLYDANNQERWQSGASVKLLFSLPPANTNFFNELECLSLARLSILV